MLKTYTYPRYEYRRPPELDEARGRPVRRVPLVVVGAGPVGLAAALDGAQRGLPVLVLDEDNTVSIGSRGVCYAKRALEIFDRIGRGVASPGSEPALGQRIVDKGVTWNVGRTFHGEQEVFSFDLLPEAGHRRPGMVNLQQYWLEQYLVEAVERASAIELRWQNKVTHVTPSGTGAELQVETPDGPYTLQCDWLVVADGARSPIRRQLGLDIEGKVFQDRFLIADIVLERELFPAARTERRFWFEPTFFGGQSALLHREADNVWRVDFQLGWDVDPEEEKKPEKVIPRVRAALDGQGFADVSFELEWASVYAFQCRRMTHFRHGRVLFVGDAAHQVSPFGARGANSGVQDTDNLMWKLALVHAGQASEALLDTYDSERTEAADENILNSTRATDFMTPKTRASKLFRQAVLGLAKETPCGRALVNSGRLSVPTIHRDSPLSTPDAEPFGGWMVPGAPADDAPWPQQQGGADGGTQGGWLLDRLGDGFVLMLFSDAPSDSERAAIDRLAAAPVPVRTLVVAPTGPAAERYDARPGTCYLMRPDQIVAARWRTLDEAAVLRALDRAIGREPGREPARAATAATASTAAQAAAATAAG
ncbi:MAG: FAD-dependent oxidoreductase [Betaproteobacteria bacterium]|nr:FAD-dependent oxidoreductase [Betaproteobacteria bacterium]